MVKSIRTLLRRIKFNLNYLTSSQIEIPINTETYRYRNPKYFDIVLGYLDQANIDKKNLEQVLRQYIVFGQEVGVNNYSKDIFSGYDFESTKKKFKPAYFNIADVKVCLLYTSPSPRDRG